jgi:SAM-dependent methyltransferase
VLDVGSGHAPHPRADVLLEKFADDNSERSGQVMNSADARLVLGDAAAMPFPDKSFDYAIASHVAEHMDDPEAFCSEVSRVAAAGYVETPGWLGDMLLREPFHKWRVRSRQGALEFRWVDGDRGIGSVSDLVYAAVYLGESRPGHRTFVARGRVARVATRLWRLGVGRLIRLPIVVDVMYTRHWWVGQLRCAVTGDGAQSSD